MLKRNKGAVLDRWKPPWKGELKFNCDISFDDLEVYAGIVLRNHNGVIKGAWTYHFYSPNVQNAEMEAMVQALILADELQLGKIIVEGNSLRSITALRGLDDQTGWRSKQFLEKGQKLLRNHPLWSICFADRLCNYSAHYLAKWARQSKFIGRLDLDNLPEIVFCDSGDPSVNLLDEVNIDG